MRAWYALEGARRAAETMRAVAGELEVELIPLRSESFDGWESCAAEGARRRAEKAGVEAESALRSAWEALNALRLDILALEEELAREIAGAGPESIGLPAWPAPAALKGGAGGAG